MNESGGGKSPSAAAGSSETEKPDEKVRVATDMVKTALEEKGVLSRLKVGQRDAFML